MNKHLETIRKSLSNFEKTEEAKALNLRLDFAEILIRELCLQSMSLDELAEKTDIKKKTLKKILHSDYNLKISEMAKIYHVLDLKLTIKKVEQESIS